MNTHIVQRFQKDLIIKDLAKKMVFLVGPRQVGKTWLSKQILAGYKNGIYLNYDDKDQQKIIKTKQWPKNTNLVVFDELHKMKDWKNYLKGLYDTKDSNLHILVTGSARLDVFRKAGDSLAGRYFSYHLLPFSFADFSETTGLVDQLLEKGGFPEPFLSNEERDRRRWRDQYIETLIKQDVFDISVVLDIAGMRGVFDRLRSSVGSVISYQNIAEDLGISPITVKRYIQLLEALYIIFQVKPYSKKISRSILKEPKVYFYDMGLVHGDEGAKFENLVALSLLTQNTYSQDVHGINKGLHYLKTRDGKEVDFLVTGDTEPERMYEVKLSDKNLSSHLVFFKQRYHIPGVQIVKNLDQELYRKDVDIEILKPESIFKNKI